MEHDVVHEIQPTSSDESGVPTSSQPEDECRSELKRTSGIHPRGTRDSTTREKSWKVRRTSLSLRRDFKDRIFGSFCRSRCADLCKEEKPEVTESQLDFWGSNILKYKKIYSRLVKIQLKHIFWFINESKEQTDEFTNFYRAQYITL